MQTSSERIRAREAAAYIGLAASTLAKMRMRGDGPPYIKAGRRVVLYQREDIDAWMLENRRTSTDPR